MTCSGGLKDAGQTKKNRTRSEEGEASKTKVYIQIVLRTDLFEGAFYICILLFYFMHVRARVIVKY